MRRCERVAEHVADHMRSTQGTKYRHRSFPTAANSGQTTAASAPAAIRALPQLCADVLDAASHVQVDVRSLEAFADTLTTQAIEDLSPPQPLALELAQPPKERAALLLAQMAVNFCYFPNPGEERWWTLDSSGRPVGQDDEANAMTASLRDVWLAQCSESGGFASGHYLAELTDADVAAIFSPAPGAGVLPMLSERASALRELGLALIATGGAAELVAAAEGSALHFCGLLAEHCPSYDDTRHASDAPYEVHAPLCFLKRAQLCAASLNGVGLKGYTFNDVDKLTVFSDYR